MPLKWLLVSFKLLGYIMKPEKVTVQKGILIFKNLNLMKIGKKKGTDLIECYFW